MCSTPPGPGRHCTRLNAQRARLDDDDSEGEWSGARPSTSQSMRYRPSSGASRVDGDLGRPTRTLEQQRSIIGVTRTQLPSPRFQAWADASGAAAEVPYTVFVHTADVTGAGTDANVYLELNGDFGSSGPRRLVEELLRARTRRRVRARQRRARRPTQRAGRARWRPVLSTAEWVRKCVYPNHSQGRWLTLTCLSVQMLEKIVVSTADGRTWQFDCNSRIVDSVILTV
jgi:hypothetical protein